jgi:hypothetical protein
MRTSILVIAAVAALVSISTGCAVESAEGTSTAPAPLRACPVILPCDAAPPTVARQAWRNWGSGFTALGGARHRGRDLFLNPGDPQWVIGRFAYGAFDSNIQDEDVDVYLLRGCGSSWELLGTARTTRAGAHDPVEGVTDSGGRVYFSIPSAKTLGLGRHRLRMVVRGDGSSAEVFIEVVERGTPVFVSDVDGTLTLSETEEVGAVITNTTSRANAGAAEALQALVKKGYRPFYMTARAEWMVQRTRTFLSERGFPQGIIHTTQGALGDSGAAGVAYKTGELVWFAGKGLSPVLGIGNTDVDSEAYANALIPANKRFFHQYTDSRGGVRFENYPDLSKFDTIPAACQ